MDLNTKIDAYIDLQKEMDALKLKIDELKTSIISDMETAGVLKATTDKHVTANLVYKETVKYSDEPAIIKYCEDNNLYNYVVKKVNTTALNKELKKSNLLKENLSNYYAVNQTKVLTVKGE